MKLIETAYAVALSSDALVHRVESAPTIVVVLMMLTGLAIAVLAIMWLFLPFAIYGLKKKLDQQTEAIESLREQMERTMTLPAATPDVAKLSLPDDEPRFRL